MKWLVLLVNLFYFAFSQAAVEGQRIYISGLDGDGKLIKSFMNDLEARSPLPCVNCHRESGLGTSESGNTIPPIAWSILGSVQNEKKESRFSNLKKERKAYTKKLLHRVLTTGVNSEGNPVSNLMPRYIISEEQTEYLIEYLETLYVKQDDGVEDEILKIATFVDPAMDRIKRQQHLKFMQGLFSMKNANTRGETKRKKFAPIQKAPQYEAYRKWKLVQWNLPNNPDLWPEALSQNYLNEPVFAVLSPLIGQNQQAVNSFCQEFKVPCLFAHGKANFKGSYYSFIYRDSDKQEKKYLNQKAHESGGDTLYVTSQLKIKTLSTTTDKLPSMSSFEVGNIQVEFNKYCNDDYTLLIKGGVELAKQIESFNCPGKQKIKVMILSDNETGYQEISNFIKNNSPSSLCWVSNYDRVLKRNMRKIRVDLLTRKFGMENKESEGLALDLYSFGLLTDAMHKLAGYFSKSYLIETIEHMLNSYPNFTYFSSVSGAPYQREIVGPLKEYCPILG